MSFLDIARTRQSCRSYDAEKQVEQEKLNAVLEAARLAPSACNGQPYHITVCKGETAKKVAKATTGMGMNKFAIDAPVQIVISEKPYVKTAAVGAKIKGNDYRSMDIGIVAAYITAEATSQGLSTCMLGWFDDAYPTSVGALDWIGLLLVCFLLPALLSLGFAAILRRIGWIKENDMKLD